MTINTKKTTEIETPETPETPETVKTVKILKTSKIVNFADTVEVKVKVKKLHPHAKMPFHGSQDAVGWDLYSDENEYYINPNMTKMIDTGIAIEIPKGYVGLIYSRSSLASKRNLTLANSVGVIDSDYRGSVKIPLHNLSTVTIQKIEPYERIGQLVIMPYPEVIYEEVEELSDTERGTGGFGSTGTK